jgi:arsenate reductase
MSDVEKMHWGLPDPSRVDGDDETVRAAFMAVIDRIELKVDEWMGEVRVQ